jgi:hypothetical protein
MFCERCGVELEQGVTRCPLCGGEELGPVEPELREYRRSPHQVESPAFGRLVVRILRLVAITAVVIVFLVDLWSTGNLSWSPVAAAAIVAGAAIAGFPFRFRRWWPTFGASIGTIFLLLVLLDFLGDARLEWFFPVALPLLSSVGAIGAAISWLFRRVRGVGKGAMILVGAGLISAAADLVVSLYRTGSPGITWSVVVLLSTFPVAVFLVVLQSTVLRYVDLRRRFHI